MPHQYRSHNRIQKENLDTESIRVIDAIRQEIQQITGRTISRKSMVNIALRVMKDKADMNGLDFFKNQEFLNPKNR